MIKFSICLRAELNSQWSFVESARVQTSATAMVTMMMMMMMMLLTTTII
jgi:hypothetical protein